MARYLSPYYPELRVALPEDKAVQFRDGEAEVSGELQDELDAFVEKNPEWGVVSEEEFQPIPRPESDLGPGYTEAEKRAALAPAEAATDEASESPASDAQAEVTDEVGEQDPDAQDAEDQLESFSRDELRELAAEKGLSTGGTKGELAERIRAAE